jgi:hypothetical protein
MTGEEIMHISRALSIMAEELSEVGLKGGEETVSDEVLDEAIELINSIRDACGEIEDHHMDRTIASDPDRER